MTQKLSSVLVSLVAMVVAFATLTCKQDQSTVDHPPKQKIHITQDDLDGATLIVSPKDTGITGDPYFANYPDTSISGKIRDLHASIPTSDSIVPGSIFVRKTYAYQNKVRGRLINTTVMVKREPGFFPAGSDFEFMKIPYDSLTDYSNHPNGMLPEISETTCRGSDQIAFASCVTCHMKPQSGSDRLFHR